MMVYKIEFYAYLPKILWVYLFLHFDIRSDPNPYPEFFSTWAGSGSVEKNVRSSSLVILNVRIQPDHPGQWNAQSEFRTPLSRYLRMVGWCWGAGPDPGLFKNQIGSDHPAPFTLGPEFSANVHYDSSLCSLRMAISCGLGLRVRIRVFFSMRISGSGPGFS